MHPQHVAALAQMRHDEYQEYARQAALTRSRRRRRRMVVGRLRTRVIGVRGYRAAAGSDAWAGEAPGDRRFCKRTASEMYPAGGTVLVAASTSSHENHDDT